MRFVLGVVLLLVGCATRAPHVTAPAKEPAAATATETSQATAEPPVDDTIPTACAESTGASGAEPCVPEPAFVKRLCSGTYPDVALTLMSKEAPFTRMYLRGDVDGWNADGGSSPRARLLFDEEVLVLRRRAPPPGAIVVGSGAGYLVMRWDGNCYTLEENELTARKPPVAKHSALPWRFYAEKTKTALLESPKVLAAFQRRGKECKGASTGDVSRTCEQSDAALADAVVGEIRSGKQIPNPDHRP